MGISLIFTHSQALQPMQGLGWLKKPPPIISISGSSPPVPESQLFYILHHSINPSQVWPPCSSSALQLVQVIFLHRRLSCIRITCPANLSLVILIVVTRSASSYKRYSSSLYLDLHTASSHMGPYILLNIFLSKTPRRKSCTLLRSEVSAPYIRTGFINVFYIVTLCFLFIFLALSIFIIPK